MIPDTGDAARDCYRRQARAVVEGETPDASDAARDRHRRQARAALKGVTLDAGDAVGDCVSSDLARRILDQGGLFSIEQHAIQAAVVAVGVRCDRDACQARTAVEGGIPDTGHAARDRHRSQPRAACECLILDADDAVRYRYRRQVRAVDEGGIPEAGDRQAVNDARDAYCPANTGVFGDRDRAIRDGVAVWEDFGNECHVLTRARASAVGGCKPVVIDLSRLQATNVRADGLRRGAAGGRKGHARRAAVGGGEAVFEMRRGGGSVRVDRTVERGTGGGDPAGGGGGDHRGQVRRHKDPIRP